MTVKVYVDRANSIELPVALVEPIVPPILEYLLYMGFARNYSAPIYSPYTAYIDGGLGSRGQLVFTQTDGQYGTSGGSLEIPAQTTPNWGDQGWIGQDADGNGFARAAGLAFLADVNISSGAIVLGYGDGTGVSYADLLASYSAMHFLATGLKILKANGASLAIGAWATSTDYTIAVISRDTGLFFTVNGELLYIMDSGVEATLYPMVANYTAVATMPTAALVQLNTDLPTVYPVPLISDAGSNTPDAEDQGSNGLDGTMTNVGVDDDGFHLDGENSFIQLDAAGMTTAGWVHETGTTIVEFTPAKIEDYQVILSIGVNAQNWIYVRQYATGGLRVGYIAGGVEVSQFIIATTTTIGVTYRVGIMWTGGNVRFYLDGVESGSAQAIAGTWAGTLLNARTLLASVTDAPLWTFPGTIQAFTATLGVAISHADMLALTNQTTNPTLTSALITAACDGDASKHMTFIAAENTKYLTDGTLMNGDTVASSADKQLLSGSWSTKDGVIYNGPVLGADVVVNGTFADGVNNWGDFGTPTTKEVISGRLHVVGDAANDGVAQAVIATAGEFFVYSFDYEIVSGWLRYDFDPLLQVTKVVTSGSGTITITALSTDGVARTVKFATSAGAGEFYIDNVTIKPFTLADLLTTDPTVSCVTPYMRASLAIDDGYQRGGFILCDDYTNPTCGVLWYLDSNDDKIKLIDLSDNSSLMSESVTPSDGAVAEVVYIPSEGKIRVRYNNAAVGSAVAYTPTAGAGQNGAFSTGCPTGDIYSWELWDVLSATLLAEVF